MNGRERALAMALALATASGCLIGCSRSERPGAPPPAVAPRLPGPASATPAPAGSAAQTSAMLPPAEHTWEFRSTPVGPMSVVVLLPKRRAEDRFPVLVTMHGRGESLKGPARGARGWVDDYWLDKAIARLHAPPLTTRDFQSLVSQERLDSINRSLLERPYRGLIVVCPYTPDILKGDGFLEQAEPLARFLVGELLPRVYRETPAFGTPATTGIDGVSLGGRAAYSVGLLRPEAFGVIAGLQAALDVEDAPRLVPRALAAKKKQPALSFRMLTSSDDYYLTADRAIARALSSAGLPMSFEVVQGPHDYEFNRGPAAFEMALFHDRALRGEKWL